MSAYFQRHASTSRHQRLLSTRIFFTPVVLALLFLMTTLPAESAENTFMLREDDRIRGDQKAPVTLLEYSDFTCGFCEKFFAETWPLLYSEYIQAGKLRLLYRDFPRAVSGPSFDTAMATRCAGEQGHYWSMHDSLFSSHQKFSSDQLQHHAEALRLDIRQFNECVHAERYRESIDQDRMEGGSLGVRGTPHFLLYLTHNSEAGPVFAIPGAFPFEVFQEHIEKLLEQASTPQRPESF